MDQQTVDRDRRTQRALERLGINDPVCVCCSELDPCCLERTADPSGEIRCRNCQAKCKPVKQQPADLSFFFCPFCGEEDTRCREDHHIAGRKFDRLTIAVCLNCHRKLTDMQKDHPK